MFKLAPPATYWWPVRFCVPSDEKPGTFDAAEFDVLFKHLTNSQNDALLADVHKNRLPDREVVRHIVVGFRGVHETDGAPVVFSQATLDKLTDTPCVDEAIVRAYFASRKGSSEIVGRG
ncbi:MAG: hypothetical protein ABI460_16540 [Caldimonas sp.]